MSEAELAIERVYVGTDRWKPKVTGLGAAEGRAWVEKGSEPEHVIVGAEPRIARPGSLGALGMIRVGAAQCYQPRAVNIGVRATGITVGGTVEFSVPANSQWEVRRFFLPPLYEALFVVSQLQCVRTDAIVSINGAAGAGLTNAQQNAVFGEAFGIEGPFCSLVRPNEEGCISPAQTGLQVTLIHIGGGVAAATNVEAEIGFEGLCMDEERPSEQCARMKRVFGGGRFTGLAAGGTGNWSVAAIGKVALEEVMLSTITARNLSVTTLQVGRVNSAATSGPTVPAGGTLGQAGIPGMGLVPWGMCTSVLRGAEIKNTTPITGAAVNNSGAGTAVCFAYGGREV